MHYQDFAALSSEGVDFGIDLGLVVADFNGLCSVDSLVALPLTTTSPMYERNSVFDIWDADTNSLIGYLVTCNEQMFDYGAAGSALVAAYLANAERLDLVTATGEVRRDYKFSRDYVVVFEANLSDYATKYRAGSALWGGFTHSEEQVTKYSAYIRQSVPIRAYPKTWVDTDAEKDALWRSVAHSSPLERFLKLYHLLELRFDLELVNSIRNLGQDLKGIGKLLNSYLGDKEFDRLLKIVRRYCTDTSFFEDLLKEAFDQPSYHLKWQEILFDYSKDSNPYKDDKAANFKNAITAGFCETEWKNQGLTWNYDHLSKFAAYMVYRVRSSIAHFRLGEFLLSSEDEAFVAEVAEPILRKIVLAAYTHP